MSAGPMRTVQLVLDLGHRTAVGREDFLVADSNREAVDLIDRWPDWPMRAVMLIGPAGSGKTHLAEVWRSASAAGKIDASVLATEAVPSLVAAGPMIVENVDLLRQASEPALFHLLNLAGEEQTDLLLTARQAPAHLNIALPDLASRLRALYSVAVAPPGDMLLGAVLLKLFDDRQLLVAEALIPFLLARMDRSIDAARRLVAALDRASLAGKRPVTVPLAAKILKDL